MYFFYLPVLHCRVPRADAVTAAGRTTETQAALVAEGVLVKTGGDESRGVVAGGELEASA